MKICHIITALGFGGAERLLVNLANVQSKTHQVHIIYLKDEPKLAIDLDNAITLHFIDMKASLPKALSGLRSLIISLNPDIIHTHLGHADFLGLIAVRGLDYIGKVCTMHNVFFKWNRKDSIIFAGYQILFGLLARRCVVGCVSKAIQVHVHKRLKVPQKRIFYIPNSIPSLKTELLPKNQLRSEFGLDQHTFVFLYVGRLTVQKNPFLLIKSCFWLAEHRPDFAFKLLIIGEGILETDLRAAAVGLPAGRVDFLGSSHLVAQYMAAADALVLSSVFEGLPTVILESFRAGLPVVASRIDGNSELIEHEQNGLLFDSNNEVAAAEAMYQISQEPQNRAKYIQINLASFAALYTIESYAHQTEELYARASTPLKNLKN